MNKSIEKLIDDLKQLGVKIDGKHLVHESSNKVLKTRWLSIEETAADLLRFHGIDAAKELCDMILDSVKQCLKEIS